MHAVIYLNSVSNLSLFYSSNSLHFIVYHSCSYLFFQIQKYIIIGQIAKIIKNYSYSVFNAECLSALPPLTIIIKETLNVTVSGFRQDTVAVTGAKINFFVGQI